MDPALPEPELSERLRTIALRAGRKVLEIRASGALDVREKADGSPQTAADLAAEAIILAELADAYPAIPVVSEECALPEIDAGQPFFLVDPLDGTRTFQAGGDAFTVNIALIADRRPAAGVVFAPALRRCYATHGADRALLEQWDDAFRSVEMRGLDATPRGSSRGAALVSRSHLDPDSAAWLAARGIRHRKPVSSSLKFGLLACGDASVYPRLKWIREWDIAAGHAVLAAAGGGVAAPDGSAIAYGHPAFIAAPFIAYARGQESLARSPGRSDSCLP